MHIFCSNASVFVDIGKNWYLFYAKFIQSYVRKNDILFVIFFREFE